MFLPWGYPAAWLLLGTVAALWAAKFRAEPFADAAGARRAIFATAICFAIYLSLFALNMICHGAALREFDKPVRYAVGVALLLALGHAGLNAGVVRAAILLAALVALAYALFDRVANDAMRVGGFMNPIQFGVLSAQVAMFNAVIAAQNCCGERGRLRWHVVGAVAALTACVLSGSLTALMSLVALPLALSLSRRCLPSLRLILLATLVICATAAVMIQMRAHIVERSSQAIDEVSLYDSSHAAHGRASSNGSRIENFKNAWDIFRSSPWLGVGNQGYREIREAQVSRGELSPYAGSFGVAHNEYLDAMAKRGLLGLAGLLVLLFGPFCVFYRFGGVGRADDNPWPTLGMIVCLGLALASLTQNVITHSSGANWLSLNIALFLGLALRQYRSDTVAPPQRA